MKLANVITMEGKYCTKRLTWKFILLMSYTRRDERKIILRKTHLLDIVLSPAALQPLLPRIQVASSTLSLLSTCIWNYKPDHCYLSLQFPATHSAPFTSNSLYLQTRVFLHFPKAPVRRDSSHQGLCLTMLPNPALRL